MYIRSARGVYPWGRGDTGFFLDLGTSDWMERKRAHSGLLETGFFLDLGSSDFDASDFFFL